MSKIESQTIDLDKLANMMGIMVDHPKWCLVREHDNMTVKSVDITWIEWNDDSTFKSRHKEPSVGRSLLMSPFSPYYAWQTTPITELISFTPDKVVFKTKNSNYTLTKIDETTV